jgi:hypothetical protein
MSSFVSASLGDFGAAAQNLTGIGSSIASANSAAAASTMHVAAAAQDEVSAAIAALFGAHGQEYQARAAQTALFHDRFVQALTSGGNAYGNTEAASAASIGSMLTSDADRVDALLTPETEVDATRLVKLNSNLESQLSLVADILDRQNQLFSTISRIGA